MRDLPRRGSASGEAYLSCTSTILWEVHAKWKKVKTALAARSKGVAALVNARLIAGESATAALDPVELLRSSARLILGLAAGLSRIIEISKNKVRKSK